MLRQVFDWAANRSTELLSRYKQMASTIGFSDNSSSYECSEVVHDPSRNRQDKKARPCERRIEREDSGKPFQPCRLSRSRYRQDKARPCGRRIEREDSGEPFQPCRISRRRRQARGKNSTGTVSNTVMSGTGVKRRCSPADQSSEDVEMSTNCLELGCLKLCFNRHIRLPLTGTNRTKDDSEWSHRETYALIVKTSKAAREEWFKLLNRQTEIISNELGKWRSRFGIFSVSVEASGLIDEQGESKARDSLRHLILVQRLKRKLREYFGDIYQYDELVVWEDGTKHKVTHFGPTEDAVERELKSGKLKRKMGISIHVQKETGIIHERSLAPTTEDLEDSFSTIEDMFWSKHHHYMKRKSGKANRKRLREPGPHEAVSKHEMASKEADYIEVSEEKSSNDNRKMRGAELAKRRSRRRGATNCKSENSSDPEDAAAQPLPKRVELMQAKYRCFMKKLEKARKESKLQSVNF